jgi:hypothetical protein
MERRALARLAKNDGELKRLRAFVRGSTGGFLCLSPWAVSIAALLGFTSATVPGGCVLRSRPGSLCLPRRHGLDPDVQLQTDLQPATCNAWGTGQCTDLAGTTPVIMPIKGGAHRRTALTPLTPLSRYVLFSSCFALCTRAHCRARVCHWDSLRGVGAYARIVHDARVCRWCRHDAPERARVHGRGAAPDSGAGGAPHPDPDRPPAPLRHGTSPARCRLASSSRRQCCAQTRRGAG